MRVRDLLGSLIMILFVALFVFMLNEISAPNAKAELGNYVIIVDLVLALIFTMLIWGPVVNGEGRLSDNLPFRIPSAVGIPLIVVPFVFLYVSGLGEMLLHVNEVASPALALTVAACILGGATWLDRRSPPVHDDGHGVAPAHDGHGAGADDAEQNAAAVGQQH